MSSGSYNKSKQMNKSLSIINKAVYTTVTVAYGWAGALMQVRPTNRQTHRQTDRQIENMVVFYCFWAVMWQGRRHGSKGKIFDRPQAKGEPQRDPQENVVKREK